jgi:hypothetical protein
MKGAHAPFSANAPSGQHGQGALILLAIVAIVAVTVFSGFYGGGAVRNVYNRRNDIALAQAKDALMGYVVSRGDPLERPGDFPCPDRATDGNYDGTQDSPCATGLLGRLPWRTAPVGMGIVQGLNTDVLDASGERLWYGVSRNVVDPTGVAQMNPDILSSAPYPWITVRDSQGNVLSNRVAAVIIAPGPIVGGQSRAGATPGAAQYLDSLTVGGTTYSNADFDGDFITAPSSNTFNDRLIFITIDEIVPLLEKRAAREAGTALRAYYHDPLHPYFPYATPFGSNECDTTPRHAGFLPLVDADANCPHPLLAGLPAWFQANGWERFMVYVLAPACDMSTPGCTGTGYLTVGTTTSVGAAIVSAGRPLTNTDCHGMPYPAQTRPSTNVCDYLDNQENTDNDNVFSGVLPIGPNFNDQSFIIAP